MKIEKLEKLQQDVNAQRLLGLEDCAALIGEVWRLRTANTAKELEVNYWQDRHNDVSAELSRMNEADQLLRADIDALKAVHGLPRCDLENRWSNCAVRLRKQSGVIISKQLETEQGAQLDRRYSGLRRFAGTLFRTSTKHKSA
jgi:hypothetical protein